MVAGSTYSFFDLREVKNVVAFRLINVTIGECIESRRFCALLVEDVISHAYDGR